MGDKHFMRILSDTNPAPDEKTRRLVLCTGKVAYDLIEAREAAGDKDIQIVRIEQLYPFPTDALAIRLKRMTALEEVVWCQEEPRNNGAWFFVEPFIEDALKLAGKAPMRARYCRTQGRRLAGHRPRQAAPRRAGRAHRRCAGSQRPHRNQAPEERLIHGH